MGNWKERSRMFETDSRDVGPAEFTLRTRKPIQREITQRIVRQELADSYSRYRSIAMRRLRDSVAGEDLVQAFSLKAIERSGQLRDPCAVHAWLRRLFETTLIDFCRNRTARGQREVEFEIEIHDRAQNPLTELGLDPAHMAVTILSRLKAEYADAIYRLDLLDQSNEEAASQLGITVNNLTVRAHRARRALRNSLDAMPISLQVMAPIRSAPRASAVTMASA